MVAEPSIPFPNQNPLTQALKIHHSLSPSATQRLGFRQAIHKCATSLIYHSVSNFDDSEPRSPMHTVFCHNHCPYRCLYHQIPNPFPPTQWPHLPLLPSRCPHHTIYGSTTAIDFHRGNTSNLVSFKSC